MLSQNTILALGKHINKLREERELSFQEMALACDMDKAQVYKLCREGIDIRASTIIKISEGLNIPVSEIFNFKH